jgi:predicted molibdopterin-dependent oxidoreductase YjgC
MGTLLPVTATQVDRVETPPVFRRASGRRPEPVDFTVDGRTLSAPAGELLASSLAAAGLLVLRTSPGAGGPRGAFCFMGLCQECLVEIDGFPRQACLTPVTAGMTVQTGVTP